MSSNGPTALPQVNPAELRVGVDPVQGGVKLTFAYPHLITQVIVLEGHLPLVLKAIEKAQSSIPKVVIP